jgi:voltage-gated potassium channel
MQNNPPESESLRRRLHTVIFEADTPGGKAFDVVLLIAILVSVVAVCLESVSSIRAKHGDLLRNIEWGLTIAFTLEYGLRLFCVDRPARYARSFYGVVDLLSILPAYLSLFFAGTQSLTIIRAIRLLRVFRVFKLGHFVREAQVLGRAFAASRRKILVFLGAVSTLMFILGTLMYLVEGDEGGFTSIPESVYWAIVTMTTVGYGDIAPVTVLGKFIASVAMICGYAIIAVPTGIVGVELARASGHKPISTRACPSCGLEGHDPDARHCKYCGAGIHSSSR